MPRITLAVLAYRQQDFVEGAVHSALAQACEPIEILLSDDCSPDDTYARMSAVAQAYRGPHQVTVRRNPTNLGIGAHVDEIVRLAQGQLLVLMAADDLSTPDRVARLAHAWDQTGQRADLIASHAYDMTFDGRNKGVLKVDDLARWPDVAAWARQRPYVIGAGHAVTKRLFERFGPMGPGVFHEDQVNTLRALTSGGACTVDAPLVHYRRGGISSALRDASTQAFLARTRRRNDQHLALHEQWLADARVAGCEPLVEGAMQHDLRRERFIQAQLHARDWKERLHEVMAQPQLPLLWRLRRTAYLGSPNLALAAQSAKALIRGLAVG